MAPSVVVTDALRLCGRSSAAEAVPVLAIVNRPRDSFDDRDATFAAPVALGVPNDGVPKEGLPKDGLPEEGVSIDPTHEVGKNTRPPARVLRAVS